MQLVTCLDDHEKSLASIMCARASVSVSVCIMCEHVRVCVRGPFMIERQWRREREREDDGGKEGSGTSACLCVTA